MFDDIAKNPDKMSTRICHQDLHEIIDTLELSSDTNRKILKSRFFNEVRYYDARRDRVKKYYNAFRFIVTTGSILLPAILSIGQMDPDKLPANFDQISYWSSWGISLTVTACNGFIQLFSLDKKYYDYAITSEQLKTEGWQFFQLSGKYVEFPNHEAAYRFFCKAIESIKRKQIEKEFSGKGDDNKKPFDFSKELTKQFERNIVQMDLQVKNLPKPESILPVPKSIDESVLSMLGKIAPEKVQEVANSLKSGTLNNIQAKITDSVRDSVQGTVQEVVQRSSENVVNDVVNDVSKGVVQDIESAIQTTSSPIKESIDEGEPTPKP